MLLHNNAYPQIFIDEAAYGDIIRYKCDTREANVYNPKWSINILHLHLCTDAQAVVKY